MPRDATAGLNEAHFREIERALLYISEAVERTRDAAKKIAADGAEQHLVAALEQSADELARTHRTLMQRTYFAVPEEPKRQLAL